MASGIPGELAGYWLAHKIGGKIEWKKLFEPAIALCTNGIRVTKVLSNAIAENEIDIRNSVELSRIYVDPITNRIYQENDVIKMPNLAKTLKIVSEQGSDAFYNGELTKVIVQENIENGTFGLLIKAFYSFFFKIIRIAYIFRRNMDN
jgi:gamma-glutamyltranspeptidase/glutathione hydrolase/leukotriene-C4 hydrolase